MGDRVRAGCAFVTGGSSGIGLAVAMLLAQDYGRIGLFARDAARLQAAADLIRQTVPGTVVGLYAVDVSDSEAVTRAVSAAIRDLGAPQRVVLSTGSVDLGETMALSDAAHRRGMEVNYFGSLWVVRAVTPHLARGAAIGLLGSAGGIIGIYGYAAYAPAKFALRGLADILRVELAGQGITVTLCLPPDTDTPMLQREERERSPVTARMAGGAARMTATAVAQALIRGMDRGRYVVLPSLPVGLMWWLAPILLPFLQWRERRLLNRLPAPPSRAASPHVFADHMDEHRHDPPGEEADRKDQRERQENAGIGG
ncbi:SDR family NAD(P)-dependent oxidoreductase [Paragemmobacter ruber]|uniref:SDR family NAD(P)-dependent oxidoreductase n=1 Tax=Paragemmobacter ruber TaxID=1985673 RepID=A0ABW9Y1P8_9RHOB|nr:SDR family NAD(P)-dependent oxidoreductase [Rhodobacter ruber]NBE06428.1 SDR family NAD(P)-dependent oxidoreductase [Rhodobacter ruber]